MAKVQARTVLWYLVFIGFAVNYMIRINLNITIVEMVMSKAKKLQRMTELNDVVRGENITSSHKDMFVDYNMGLSNASLIELRNQNFNSSITIPTKRSVIAFEIDNATSKYENQYFFKNKATKFEKFSIEKYLLRSINIECDENGFEWNEYQQGLVLGGFFWAHWVTQIPGGLLAKKFGTKIIFGLSNATGAWMCFFIPIISYLDYRALVWWRVLQGLVCGLSWPAMHVLTAQWIPPNERSKFVTAYLGGSVGIAIFYPLFGYVISWTSWEWVYYICGIVGTLWWLGWILFVYDTPALHPRIEEQEVSYIQKSLGSSVQTKPNSTPWKEILTSKPVWMNVIAQWGGIWGLFTLMTQAPTYFKVIHNWDIKTTGILSGLPHLMRMIFAYIFSMLGDYLLRTEKMSRTNVRKLATTFCCIVKGCVVLALALYGHNSIAAIVFLTIATMFHGAVSSGPLASIVDIAPNYAGIVLGISGMIGVLPGFISPIIVGMLTLENQTFESWKYVFLITAGMLIGCGLLYVLFGSSTLQIWNTPQNFEDDKERHLLSGDAPTENSNIKQKSLELLNQNSEKR
ncbi:sialin [Episyrphus balteatus]|uniref:sialin n=1 Tax=Episyrphus balteatus TaxID=286459 RepID=UPI002485B00B|nr:sialin [Episyrphus balteatus]